MVTPMYSVLRFRGPAAQFDALGAQVNAIMPGAYDGPDRVGGRFSLSLSQDPIWNEHRRQVGERLQQLASVIQTAACQGFAFELDLAIDREDLANRLALGLTFDQAVLRQLNDLGIELTLTIYSLDK